MIQVLSTLINSADVDDLREVTKSTVKRQCLNSNRVRNVRLTNYKDMIRAKIKNGSCDSDHALLGVFVTIG